MTTALSVSKRQSSLLERLSGVLRSLRHCLRAQSKGHHTIDRLEERGVERGSPRRSSLKGREGAIVNHTNIGIVAKARLGKHLRDGAERIWAFSKRIDAILNWTELSWTELNSFHALSLAFRHHSSKEEGCRKPMLGVWVHLDSSTHRRPNYLLRRAAQFITRWTLFTSFWGIPANRELQSNKKVQETSSCQEFFVASVVRNRRINPTFRISKYAVWQILSTWQERGGESMVKHDTLITGRITKRYVTLANFYNIRKVRGFGLVEEQCFSIIFVQLKLVVDGPLLYVTDTVSACCR